MSANDKGARAGSMARQALHPTRRRRHPLALALALALLAEGAPSLAEEAPPARHKEAPGEGVLCSWALIVVTREVARQCFPGRDPAFEAELDNAVARIDRYVAANAKITQADVDRFKREQGKAGASKEFLCTGDSLQIYDGFRKVGASRLHQEVDALTSRPGMPSWGDCL